MEDLLTLDQRIDELSRRINYLQDIVNLQKESGWKHLYEHFLKITEITKDALTEETNLQNITRLQERYRAFKSLTESVSEFEKELQLRLQEIQIVRDEKQTRVDYGQI